MSLYPYPESQFFDSSGVPLAGGKLFTYQPGTTSLKATYQDLAGVTYNTNPITLDAAGRANIFLDGYYDMTLLSATGVLIWVRQNYYTGSYNLGVTGLTASGLVSAGDFITEGPWIDARAYTTLALADAAAVTAGKLLLVSSAWSLAADTTLSSSIMCIPGAAISYVHHTLTIAGPFVGCPGCLVPGYDGVTVFSNGAAPTTATSTGYAGTVAWDSGYIYICTASNTWKRAAIASW